MKLSPSEMKKLAIKFNFEDCVGSPSEDIELADTQVCNSGKWPRLKYGFGESQHMDTLVVCVHLVRL